MINLDGSFPRLGLAAPPGAWLTARARPMVNVSSQGSGPAGPNQACGGQGGVGHTGHRGGGCSRLRGAWGSDKEPQSASSGADGRGSTAGLGVGPHLCLQPPATPPRPRSAPLLPEGSAGPRVLRTGGPWGPSGELTSALPPLRPECGPQGGPQWARLPWPGLRGPCTNPHPSHGLKPT